MASVTLGELYNLFKLEYSVPVFRSSCSPNEMTGIAEAKNIYVVGAQILYREAKICECYMSATTS